MRPANPAYPMPSPDSDSPRRRRIAVIAIHGVADQQPEDTANTVANLLLNLPNNSAPAHYHGFKTHRLRIAHRGVALHDCSPTIPGDASEQCQHQFLRRQLENFEEPGPDATYETIRNEALRRDKAKGDREVHIYEMYWADLSRLGNSFLTFFVELYQLLFHLCTVGDKMARFARAQHEDIWWWRCFSRKIHCASYFIRLPIPICNLFVMAIIALALSAQIDVTGAAIRLVTIAIIPVVIAGFGAMWLRKVVRPRTWPFIVIGVIVVVGGLIWAGQKWFFINDSRIAGTFHLEVWALLVFALLQVIIAYDRRHPGALEWGIAAGGVASVLLLVSAINEKGGALEVVCKRAATQLLIGVGVAWLVAIIAAAVGLVAGWRALANTDNKSRPSARRAVFTANLTTALTGMVMLIINISLWGMIPTVLKKLTPEHYGIVCQIADQMEDHLKTVTIIPGMTTLVFLMAAAALWMIWALIPAVRSEITTPAPDRDPSRWIGKSLTNAFRVMTWAGYLSMACFGGLLALFSILSAIRQTGLNFHLDTTWLPVIPYLEIWDKKKAASLFSGFSGVILLFIIAPFFLKGFVVKLSAGFRQGLDVALDVINYLRENPMDSTIRAQIFARYVSLLRYVCNWKSPIDAAGYDRIIIFAHSQGTMITVDLLRYLQVEHDPNLSYLDEPDRIRLFTMGCPLRQLYGLRFPHLYDWARHSPSKPGDPEAVSKTGTDESQSSESDAVPDAIWEKTTSLPDDRLPNPDRLLAVGKWVNAYRSGDYVGRNLWRSETDDEVYDPKVLSQDSKKKRREFCIGGGAHTHYWDKTAPQIVAELDRLIANA